MAKRAHKANVHGATVGGGGLADQMARRKRQDGTSVGGDGEASTSIFDPVLAELLIRWFCPPKGLILDPFAGGSVRGIVAAKLGRQYVGIDLRKEQIAANELQVVEILKPGDGKVTYIVGDSSEELSQSVLDADFVFTCPPYVHLERYSDDPRDLSTMRYDLFFIMFQRIMGLAVRNLRDNRFCAFVVGDVRDKDGAYYGFPAHCVKMMQDWGLKLWNEAPLVTPPGSLPTRTRNGFEKSRKLGRTHQTVYVFVKGDAVKATAAVGPCDFGTGDPLEAQIIGDDPAAGLGVRL